MMRPTAVLILLAGTTALAATEVRFITEDAPPLTYLEGDRLAGPAAEIVRLANHRLGWNGRIEVLPWARGYQLAQERADVALFSTTRTEAREHLFQWAGPLARQRWVFFARRESGLHPATLEETRTVHAIGTYAADAKGQWLREQGFTNLDEAATDEANARKLAAGRIDLWIAGPSQGLATAKAAGVDPATIEPVLTARTSTLYVAFSRQTDPAVVQRFQEALDALQTDGTYDRVYDAIGEPWR